MSHLFACIAFVFISFIITFAERLFNFSVKYGMETLEKRKYIISKCYKLLLLKGFDGVSISDIQKECGVARGLLYHYFGGKDELFYEVVSDVVLPKFYVSSEETAGMNLRKVLDFICKRYSEICIDDELEGMSLLNFDFLIYRVTQVNMDIRNKYEMVLEQELKILEAAIVQSVVDGDLVTDAESSELAILTASLISGIWMNSLYKGDSETLFKRLRGVLALHLSILKHR